MATSPPYVAIGLVSAAALSYEVLLMRLFSIIQWHHFAYMMISVALLGYGAAGAFVTLTQDRLGPRYSLVFASAATCFGLLAPGAFLASQSAGFNALEILWDPGQPGRLMLIYALLILPFFCAATAICLSFARFPGQIPQIYAADITGGAAGGLGSVALLVLLPPARALAWTAVLGLCAGALAGWRGGRRGLALGLILAGGALLALPPAWLSLKSSPYKELAQTLEISGSRVLKEVSSPLGVLTVVESPQVPFRLAPGLSLMATTEPPAQLALFTDGDGMTAINRFDGDWGRLAYLDQLSSALPYHLLSRPEVLILGAGGGTDVLQALALGARRVDAVELNPAVIALVQDDFGAFSGRPFSLPGVQVHIDEARGFVAKSLARYDLIQVALLDAFSAAAAGLHGLTESYLYTVEALGLYLDHLQPGGLLAITRWVTLPPRDALKLVAMAIAALEARGIADPGQHLAMIRGWKTTTLLVKPEPLTAADLQALNAFRQDRGFDAVWYPGMRAAEANRYNILARPFFYEGVTALLSERRADFLERYKFVIDPATDDRPYFFRFFRWESLGEILALKDRGGLSLLDWGYPVVIATLLQALVFGLLLTLVPLWWFLRRRPGVRGGSQGIARYFAALGLAFMLVEIAFIQRFTLFLSHPVYAVALVLTAFLLFAGLGSRWAGRWRGQRDDVRLVRLAVLAIGGLTLVYVLVLPGIFLMAAGLPLGLKMLMTLGLIAPLAFAMGLPFPLGLARVAARTPALVPWAWAVNGFASVVAAVLATVLAIHWGFTVVVILAVFLYLIAAVRLPGPVAD